MTSPESTVRYGKVVYRVLAGVGDGPDANVLPDGIPVTGTGLLTPRTERVIDRGGFPSTTVLPRPIRVSFVNGFLTYRNDPHVWLIASEMGVWRWHASFTYKIGSDTISDEFLFDLPPGEPNDPDYRGTDLTTARVVVAPQTGIPTVVGPPGRSVVDVIVQPDALLFVMSQGEDITASIPKIGSVAGLALEAERSATAAKASETAAKTSQTAAKASEDAAGASETASKQARDAAQAARDTAVEKAQESAESADTALTRMRAAAESAQAAAQSETNAASLVGDAADLAAIAGEAATRAVEAAEEVNTPIRAVAWSSAHSLEFDSPAWIKATLSGNATVTLSNGVQNKAYTVTVEVVQDATGGRTLALPGVLWPSGVAPALSTAGGSRDLLHLTWTGGRWLGSVGGLAFATIS